MDVPTAAPTAEAAIIPRSLLKPSIRKALSASPLLLPTITSPVATRLTAVTEAPLTVTLPLKAAPSEKVGLLFSTTLPVPVEVVTPVPPLATPSVPPRVSVPEVVIGPPLKVRPVDPPEAFTEVTVPT